MTTWAFSKLDPSGTIVATEPDGTAHVVKHGYMDSAAGRDLLNAMVRALAAPPAVHGHPNPDWPAEAEARIDVIGQNGNTGDHYEPR